MEVIGFKFDNLSKDKYFEKHLEIINAFLPYQLAKKEIEVIASFMSLEGDIIDDENRFNSLARKKVKKKHKLTSANLSNYLKAYKEKKVIYEEDDMFKIYNYFFPSDKAQGYKFKITKEKQ